MKEYLKIILVIALVLVAIFMMIQSIHGKELIPINSDEQQIIKNTEKKVEFLLLHNTLSELSKTWPESKIRPYRKAVEKFPDVDACLIAAKNVDTIDWSRIQTTTELEVCLSRIHTFIGDVQKSQEWFRRHGFHVIIQSYFRGDPPEHFHSLNSIWSIPSAGSFKDRKSPLSGLRIYFEELFAKAGLSVGLEINQEGVVTHVETGYSRK